MKTAIFVWASTLLFGGQLIAAPHVELGPMLGHVSPESASIWIKASGPGIPSVVVGRQDDLADGMPFPGPELTEENDFMSSIDVGGLEADTPYVYAIAIGGQVVTQQPFPRFSTPIKPGGPGHQRVAFTSCLGREGAAGAAAWAQMDAAADADLVLLLGDNHYADTTARKGQVAAYFSNRSSPGFRAISSRVPVYGIWDDHDYGPNDSDGSAVGKEQSLATFKQFWPVPSYGEGENPGIYYRFRRGDIEFFMLDVRYHRSPDKMVDDGTKTMLGERQLAWLKEGLRNSDATIKIIASGSEWQRHGHADSWTSYPREREELFDFLREERITGILLVSGDRHFTGGYQIGGEFIEVTAGPLGAKNHPTKNLPQMIFNEGEGKLYAVFDIDTTRKVPEVSIEVHRAGDGIVHRQNIPWAAILGEEQLELLPVETVPEKAPFQIPSGQPETATEKLPE